MRTSETHPLFIAEVPMGLGAIGVTFAPGKHQALAMTGSWARDLETDLRAIQVWGASVLVSLIEPFEFEELSIMQLPARAAAHGLEWHGLPIIDRDAPDQSFLKVWQDLSPRLIRTINSGGRVVVHCKGGLGRAGTVACLLSLEGGALDTAEKAIKWVRRVRPGAVESDVQKAFLASVERGLARSVE